MARNRVAGPTATAHRQSQAADRLLVSVQTLHTYTDYVSMLFVSTCKSIINYRIVAYYAIRYYYYYYYYFIIVHEVQYA